MRQEFPEVDRQQRPEFSSVRRHDHHLPAFNSMVRPSSTSPSLRPRAEDFEACRRTGSRRFGGAQDRRRRALFFDRPAARARRRCDEQKDAAALQHNVASARRKGEHRVRPDARDGLVRRGSSRGAKRCRCARGRAPGKLHSSWRGATDLSAAVTTFAVLMISVKVLSVSGGAGKGGNAGTKRRAAERMRVCMVAGLRGVRGA